MKRFFNNIVVKFILITLVFFIITSPIVVLFGPFGNLKRAVVGAIMRSRHPQYITWLYNQEELNQILGTVTTTDKQNVFSFKPRTDATLKLKRSRHPVSSGICWKSQIRNVSKSLRQKISMRRGIPLPVSRKRTMP